MKYWKFWKVQVFTVWKTILKNIFFQKLEKSRFLEQENIGSFIGVALRAAEIENTTKQPVVGVLYFNYRAPRNFDAELIRVLDIFARQTANIIYRNRLIEDIHKQNALMQAVNQASLRIGEQANPQEQLHEIIRSGIQLLDAKGGKIYKIIHDELLFADAQGNYTKVVTTQHTLLPSMTFSSFEELLPSTHFLRVHRSFLVNKAKITHIEGNRVFVQNYEIPIGNSYREDFLKRLGL